MSGKIPVQPKNILKIKNHPYKVLSRDYILPRTRKNIKAYELPTITWVIKEKIQKVVKKSQTGQW